MYVLYCMYSTVLYCTVLYCTVIYCTQLYSKPKTFSLCIHPNVSFAKVIRLMSIRSLDLIGSYKRDSSKCSGESFDKNIDHHVPTSILIQIIMLIKTCHLFPCNGCNSIITIYILCIFCTFPLQFMNGNVVMYASELSCIQTFQINFAPEQIFISI